jgi:TPR repeat protein
LDKGQGVAQDYAEAVKWYRKAAEQHLAWAQFNLGLCYAKSDGVKQDYVEAYAWYDLAAKTRKGAAKSRDALEKQMSSDQVVAAQRRA